MVNFPQRSYRIGSFPIGPQTTNYIEDNYNLVDNLSEEVQKKLMVKVYTQDFNRKQEKEWNYRFPNISVYPQSSSIKKVLENSKIVISTCNSTTFLETMYLNIPSILYFDDRIWEIHDEAKSIFLELKKNKIFFNTYLEAANHLNEINQDIQKWWNSEELQTVRTDFLNFYAAKYTNPINHYAKMIKSQLVK
jgi:putative transferase (TIGR04331 family)